MSKIYGYIRVSTREQNEIRQLVVMKNFGVPSENIFIDKQTVTRYHNRKTGNCRLGYAFA